MSVSARSLFVVSLMSMTAACGSEASPAASEPDAMAEGGLDSSSFVDAPPVTDANASDAPPVDPGGKVAFVNTYPSGFGGARIAAVPDGGWVAAFGHSSAIAIAGKTLTPSGRYDIVLVRLAADGSVIVRFSPKGTARWARGFSATAPSVARVSDLAVSSYGTAVIGTFQGTADLGMGPRASASTSGRSDTFIVGMSP